MRVALLAWETKYSIAVGGLAEHVSALAAALGLRGHEVHVFTRIAPGQTGYDCIDGVHYHRCPYQTHPDFLVDVGRMGDSFVWHLTETESYLGAKFDVVHGHDWMAVGAMTQAKNRHGRPVVMTVHSTEYGRCGNQLWEGLSRRIREIEWEGTYVADRLICVSGALRREVQDLYQCPGDKMYAIYNGVDVHRFDLRVDRRSARRRFALGAADPLVLFAGRMTTQKGPDLLLDAMPGVLREHPRAKVVFAGDGDLRPGLETQAGRLGVRPAIRFVGHRAGRDLVTLFKTADLVCVPSRNEPFGIVILEAWSARKPVVATRNGGPAEFVSHDYSGLTVGDDRDSIGRGVGAVLADRDKGRRMGRNGRREAESRFSWGSVAAATERVYQSARDGLDYRPSRTRLSTREAVDMARQGQGRPKKQADTARTARSTPTKEMTRIMTPSPRATAPPTGRATADPAVQTPKARPARTVSFHGEPSDEAIRRRAYEIYLEREGQPGNPMDDWLQAERELKNTGTVPARRRGQK